MKLAKWLYGIGLALLVLGFLGAPITGMVSDSRNNSPVLFILVFFVGIVFTSAGQLLLKAEKAKLKEKWEEINLTIVVKTPDFKNQLIGQVISGNTRDAILTLKSLIPEGNNAASLTLTQLLVRLETLQSEVAKGVLTKEQEYLERNKINDSFIGLVNRIQFIVA